MIYLDNAAATKPKKEAVDAIVKCLTDEWGNPSSVYRIGIRARDIVESSRKIIADFIGARQPEIIFTSGACESNSLGICGYLKKHKTVFITTGIEHKSVIDIANAYNGKTVFLPVTSKGFIDLNKLEEVFKKYPGALASIQYANNEIGTVQDIKETGRIVHKYGGILHTDATQIMPDREINVKDIDMLSFSGSKLGAAKGIGVLYVKNGIKINPVIYGAQEKSLRGGTENVPYIAGLAEAVKNTRYPSGKLRDYFVDRVLSEIKDSYLVGCTCNENRLKNNASVCFKGIGSEALLLILDQKDIYVSAGSACNSALKKQSYVLKEIHMPEEDTDSVIRFTFGDNTKEETDIVITELKMAVKRLRSLKQPIN